MSVRSFRSSKRWAFLRYGMGAWLFVSLFFGAVAIPEAWAATYFVNATTGNNANTAALAMSAATPWRTITRAITEPTLTSGDVVNVAAGLYDSTLGETFPLFLVNGVAIIGAGTTTRILAFPVIFENSNTPLSASTRLSAVQLESQGGVGMQFELESVAMAPRIDGVTFTDTLLDGIQILESTAGNSSFTGIIENNTFDGGAHGVNVFQNGGGSGDVYSPTIRNNSFTGAGAFESAILLSQSGLAAGIMAPTITGNTFTNSGVGVEYSGNTFTGSSVTFAPLISNNTFTSGVQQITLSASDISLASNGDVYTFSPTITNNTLSGGTSDAIALSLSVLSTGHLVSTATITGNTITNSASDGMELSISELFGGNGVEINWTIANNTITDASSDGISLSVSSLTGGGAAGTFCVTLQGNTITSSGVDGMSLSLSPGSLARVAHTLLVRGNTMTGNGTDGLSLSISSQQMLTSNTIDITNNVISNNGDDGLEIGSSDATINGILVSCNTISGNADDGIDVESGTAPPADFGGGNRGSPGNNNITANVDFAMDNFDESPVKAENNFWGLTDAASIDAEIRDDNENPLVGAVDFEPFRTTASGSADCPLGTAACAGIGPTPIPTLTPTVTPTGQPPVTTTPTPPATPTPAPSATPVTGPPPANVPTLGGWGMLLLVGLLALSGIVLSRRGGPLVILLLLFLAPGHGFGQADKGKGKPPKTLHVGAVQKLERADGFARLRLNDGTLLTVAEGDLKLEDRRFRREKGAEIGTDRLEARGKAKREAEAALRAGKIAAGQAVLLKIKRDRDGTIKKLKVFLYESQLKARKALERIQLKREERRKAIGR